MPLLFCHPLVMSIHTGAQLATRCIHLKGHPFEGSKQQAGSIHKPCHPLKTNHRAKRDWVVAHLSRPFRKPSSGPAAASMGQASHSPFVPPPHPCPGDMHCKEITVPTELFRAALSVRVITNVQIATGTNLRTSKILFGC